MRDKKNLQRLLNLNYLDFTNKTVCIGEYDLPKLFCDIEEYPDYIALYSQPCEYHKTANTCVSFYDYDVKFDGQNGLYDAIYHKNEKRLDEFKTRFRGVKFFIGPDYSECGDVPVYHNLNSLGKARETSLWLALNMEASVIPNIPCCRERELEYLCDGLEDVTVVAFSTKGRTDKPKDIYLIKQSVHVVIEKLPNLKAIIVYDVSISNRMVDKLFSEARELGIKIIVPDNLLKKRNIERSKHVQYK